MWNPEVHERLEGPLEIGAKRYNMEQTHGY